MYETHFPSLLFTNSWPRRPAMGGSMGEKDVDVLDLDQMGEEIRSQRSEVRSQRSEVRGAGLPAVLPARRWERAACSRGREVGAKGRKGLLQQELREGRCCRKAK